MDRITLLENEYATLWFYPAAKIVHHRFHKPIGGKAFRDVLGQGLELMKDTGTQKWLSDDRANSILAVEDTEWSNAYWRPRAVAAGWRYWAVVLPEKHLGQTGMGRIAAEVEAERVIVEGFSDPDLAMAWLEKQ